MSQPHNRHRTTCRGACYHYSLFEAGGHPPGVAAGASWLSAMPRKKTSLADKAREDAMRWLQRSGWSVVPAQEDGAAWSLSAEIRDEPGVMVTQNAGDPYSIIVHSAFDIGEVAEAQIGAWPADKRRGFIIDLQIELLRIDIEFLGIEEPLKTIRVLREIYAPFTRSGLLRTIRRVRNSGHLVALRLMQQLRLGEAAPDALLN